MRVVFLKITSMKYYKGPSDDDPPSKGGKFVEEYGMGYEAWNFLPVEENGQRLCYGFVEPKSNRGNRNTIHIENITGEATDKKADKVDDVLVIWCATTDRKVASVVGWYKEATVYRDLLPIMRDDMEAGFNVVAEADNCVLLPRNKRDRHEWEAPVSKLVGYGFGSAMTWYPTLEEPMVKKILKNIEEYKGDNWLYVFNQ